MPGFVRGRMTRRRLAQRVLQLGIRLAALVPFGPQALAASDAAPPAGGDGGLKRLWAALEKRLQQPRNALPLPWREAFLPPATARLVWHARSLTARTGGASFRVAIDPLTQWYFVAEVPADGVQPRYFGPIAEAEPGVFVEAIASVAASARAPKKKRVQP